MTAGYWADSRVPGAGRARRHLGEGLELALLEGGVVLLAHLRVQLPAPTHPSRTNARTHTRAHARAHTHAHTRTRTHARAHTHAHLHIHFRALPAYFLFAVSLRHRVACLRTQARTHARTHTHTYTTGIALSGDALSCTCDVNDTASGN
jgi:hypothetical protein